MTELNFLCTKCRTEFDCNVGKISFPVEENRPRFEKNILCPRCGVLTMDEVELTEPGQTQLGAVFFAELKWNGGRSNWVSHAKKEKEEENIRWCLGFSQDKISPQLTSNRNGKKNSGWTPRSLAVSYLINQNPGKSRWVSSLKSAITKDLRNRKQNHGKMKWNQKFYKPQRATWNKVK